MRPLRSRLPVVGGALALIVAACGNDSDVAGTSRGDGSADPDSVEQTESTLAEDVPSALRDGLEHDDFPDPLIDPAQLISGGPPPDGIPALDDPKFLAPEDVEFLEDTEPVIAVELDGDARAYPLQIMTWHEIVNDTIAGTPVTVTYCPLCNTAIAYDRRLDDRILDFGTSGMLYQSALVMYDRQTESLWSHFSSEGLAGVLAGERLETYPATIISWETWRDRHSDGLVLSRETGHSRDYGRNPYPGYDDIDSPAFLFEGEVDGRLAGKERVAAFGLDVDPVAVRFDELAEQHVHHTDLDGEPVVVWHLPGTASGLDTGRVSGGRDVGAVAAYESVVDGEELTFSRDGEEFVDDQTSSRWDFFGQAVEGPLEGSQLDQVAHVDTFWFAWAAYQPDTRIEP